MLAAGDLEKYVKALKRELAKFPEVIRWRGYARKRRPGRPQGGIVTRCAWLPREDFELFGEKLDAEVRRLADELELDIMIRPDGWLLVPSL
jgi:hypothetical protein